jgi:hypothetical protein
LSVTLVAKIFDLTDAAITPGPAAAAAAAAATATAATASPAASAATSAAATSTTPGDFFAELMCCSVFLVEDIERRQADVRDFLLTEKDFVSR